MDFNIMDFHAVDCVTIIISIILNVFISTKICRGLHYIYILFNQNLREEKVYIYQFSLKNDLKGFNFQCVMFIVWSILFFYSEKHVELFITIFISIVVFYYSTHPDKNHVFAVNNLHIGYGAALAYYKNYLEMTMTESFSERIEKFSSENMIQMQKKLFILVPESCRIHNYLDSIEHENIERCRELPDGEITHSGIKNRTYNITIYNINGVRMAVEFAQPLKALYLFKEKGFFTINQMLDQRKLFSETLKEFLKQDPFKYFEVVEYNDSVDKIDEVLTKSYQNLSKSYNFKIV